MRELEYFDDKRKIAYIYDKKIKGEILDDNLERAFQDLTKKWEKKLNLPKNSLLEEIPVKNSKSTNEEIWTRQDENRLKQLKNKQKNGSFDSIFEEAELIDLEKKKESIKLNKLQKVIQEKPVKSKDVEFTGSLNNPKNIKQFKGTTKDGMLPGNESIDRYFTKNVATTGKHDEIIYKWVYEGWYNDAQFYHNELQWDEKKLRKWIKKEYKLLSLAEKEEKIQEILREWKQFKELMNGGELKKNMLLHRTQRKLHGWPNPEVGQKVIINADRSFSISKEGVDEYRKGGKKGWWTIELEAPAKTKGVYISPKAISEEHNNKYIRQMEVIVGPDTQAEIIYIDPAPDKKLIRLRAIV